MQPGNQWVTCTPKTTDHPASRPIPSTAAWPLTWGFNPWASVISAAWKGFLVNHLTIQREDCLENTNCFVQFPVFSAVIFVSVTLPVKQVPLRKLSDLMSWQVRYMHSGITLGNSKFSLHGLVHLPSFFSPAVCFCSHHLHTMLIFGSSSFNLSGQRTRYLLALLQLIAHTEFSSNLPPTGSWQLHFDLPPRKSSQSFWGDKRNKMTEANILQCGKSKMCSASRRRPNQTFLLEGWKLLIMGIKWTTQRVKPLCLLSSPWCLSASSVMLF